MNTMKERAAAAKGPLSIIHRSTLQKLRRALHEDGLAGKPARLEMLDAIDNATFQLPKLPASLEIAPRENESKVAISSGALTMITNAFKRDADHGLSMKAALVKLLAADATTCPSELTKAIVACLKTTSMHQSPSETS